MQESPYFMQRVGLLRSPLPIEKLINASNWLLNECKREEENIIKPVPEFDGSIREESDDDERSESSMDAENDDDNKFTLMALSPVNLNEHKASESFGCASSIAQKKVDASTLNQITIDQQNTLSSPKDSIKDDLKNETIKRNYQKSSYIQEENRDEKILDSEKYCYINSIQFQGGFIRVLRSHLNRILKLRQSKKANQKRISVHDNVPRMRSSGPIHDSRSRLAKKRLRDQNGRFFTKEECEEFMKFQFKHSIYEYFSTHLIPGVCASELQSKSYEELLKIFPIKIFKIEHNKIRNKLSA